MDLVDSTILHWAVWLMGTVDLEIPRTTKLQQKYQEMVILNIADMKILTKFTKHSIMKTSMSIQTMMWYHTTNISYTSMIATTILSTVTLCSNQIFSEIS